MDLIEKFDAKGASGAAYHVEVYQAAVERPDTGAVPGPKTYRLDDGRVLSPHSEDKLRIVQTGEKIYRV
jgi:hypothetical protein